jgi:DNA repair protein RecO (recombination protein O)
VGRPRSAQSTLTRSTRAVVLKRSITGESDLIVQLFTEDMGRVAAIARAARKSQKRFGGALEPFHTLRMQLDERATSELLVLRESSIDQARSGLLLDLSKMEAAGLVLGWVRDGSPQRTREPEVWAALLRTLDSLETTNDPRAVALQSGLVLTRLFGWGMDLDACVGCGKPCAPGRTAMLSVVRGGLVCRACGGGPLRLTGSQRARLSRAARGESGVLQPDDHPIALLVTTESLRLHARIA